jgi:alpha-galactosidase
MKRHFLFLLLWPLVLQAQKQISIPTQHSSLIFSIGADQKLYQSYFGKRLSPASIADLSPADAMESYLPAGVQNLFEPAIRIVHADGNPSLDLVFAGVTTQTVNPDNTITRITLKDPVYPVTVELCFSAWFSEDVISTWTEIVHTENKPVRLYNFASSMLHFNADSYWLTQFHGDFAKEARMQESRLTSGIRIIDSKLGSRADMFQTPAFFLSLNGPSTETTGELIAGTLAWSGNFQFLFEMDDSNKLNVISGINPYASDQWLAPNKRFVTPEFIFTYSAQGKGEASRSLQRWARNYGVLDGKGPRYTLLNNWEATQFDFNEKKLDSLLDQAHLLGVDLFLLDDGWFGNKYPRNDDHAGLGDWQENRAKLPDGIGRLVRSADEKGVKFGIWLEPEMVNPQSELYEKHRDWVLELPNRPEDYFRNQLVLDLLNPAVQDFVFNTVDGLLTRNPGIAYIKWDCNRMMTNTYSPYAGQDQSAVFTGYVRGFYAVLKRLRAKYPTLPMMLCAGGGGRTDYGALKYFTEFWPSDNTDAIERIFIQWGYSYFFPANTIACHIASWGDQSLKFRTDVAMMGRMGYDLDIAKLSATDLDFSQEAVRNYKRLSSLIWQGDQYKLVDPYDNQRAVLLYADSSRSHAVVFAYNLHPRYGTNWTPVRLQGLDPQKTYTVREIDLYPGTVSRFPENNRTFTGEYLMTVGLHVSGEKALTSEVIELRAAGEDQESLTIPFGKDNKIVCDLGAGTYSVYFHHKLTIDHAYVFCKGTEQYDSRDYGHRVYTIAPIKNALGAGTEYTIIHSGMHPMNQRFDVYPNRDYFITSAEVATDSCNYMAPLVADEAAIGNDGHERALFVPFDNDMWVRYNAAKLSDANFTGSEVAAFYNDSTMQGIVTGSLDQDTWKSGVRVKGDDGKARLTVFAGFTDSITTHDHLAHGMVHHLGKFVRSPRILIGDFTDWRTGMETYARLDSLAAPKVIFHWNRPTPMGWNSWGAIQDKLTLAKAKAVIDFFADSCKGFRNGKHTLFIDLDAFWDNMTPGGVLGDVSKLDSFVVYCHAKGFHPGIYWTPFADWGKTDRQIEGSAHRYPETWTRQNGQVMDVDGGRAMDPTHPGTRDRIVATLTRLEQIGFEMIKIDFLGHGALEADHFYDPAVTTGMQAFNKGMAFVDSVLDGKMLVYSAISPNIATARYVHMRRIGCDAFSAIDNTEYTLNSTGYGWWQSGLYDYVDADHVVFNTAPDGMNRARLTSSLVTGTLMTGDDYGKPGKWRQVAEKLLQNPEVLAAVGNGKAWRPVYANTGNRGVQVFEKGKYLAVINYEDHPRAFLIPGSQKLRGLFNGQTIQPDASQLTINIAGNDAEIFVKIF